jgi:hypothetical protein
MKPTLTLGDSGKVRKPAVPDCLSHYLSPRPPSSEVFRWQGGCGAQGRQRPEHCSRRGSDSLTPARQYLQRQDIRGAGTALPAGRDGMSAHQDFHWPRSRRWTHSMAAAQLAGDGRPYLADAAALHKNYPAGNGGRRR